MPRFAQLAVAAAVQAVRDANLEMQKIDRERVGVLIGTAFGGAMDESQDAAKTLIERGPMKISPFYMVRLLPNMAAHHVSCYFDTKGYTSTVVVACASGTQAIGEADRGAAPRQCRRDAGRRHGVATQPVGLGQHERHWRFFYPQ